MIIGFSGSQRGMTKFQKDELKLRLEGCTEFVHGDCIGSDEQANNIALECGISIFTIFPPTGTIKRAFCFNKERNLFNDNMQWNEIDYDGRVIQVRWYPKNEYLKRNQLIVNYCESMIATPKEYEHTLRSGTWATIRFAWKTKKNILIIPPVNR